MPRDRHFMINVEDLEFTYDQHGFRLRIENMTVPQGQRVAWSGPSGTGKTTLLQLVAGILLPRTGRVTVCDTELTCLDDAARAACDELVAPGSVVANVHNTAYWMKTSVPD